MPDYAVSIKPEMRALTLDGSSRGPPCPLRYGMHTTFEGHIGP